jgi:hypothetical protein
VALDILSDISHESRDIIHLARGYLATIQDLQGVRVISGQLKNCTDRNTVRHRVKSNLSVVVFEKTVFFENTFSAQPYCDRFLAVQVPNLGVR